MPGSTTRIVAPAVKTIDASTLESLEAINLRTLAMSRGDAQERPSALASVEIGKDFMFSHGYIKNDFDVSPSAAPEFIEQAARESCSRNAGRK
ncbi:MAG: hypothetical protein WBQ66_06865 [Blastocatellia bacterium]